MKKHLFRIMPTVLVLGSAVLIPGATTARAEDKDQGFYLGADAGVNLADDLVSDFGSSASVSLNPGIRGDFFAGYAFGLSDHLTLAPELELGAIYNSFGNGSASGQNTSGGGDLVQVPLMVNAVLSYKFSPRWSTYGGVGVGAEYFDVSVSDGSSLSGLAGSEGDVAWQVMIGIQCKLGPGDLGLGYKYLGCSALFFNNIGNNTISASYTIHF
jgi:opacity protein-like surface antigen